MTLAMEGTRRGRAVERFEFEIRRGYGCSDENRDTKAAAPGSVAPGPGRIEAGASLDVMARRNQRVVSRLILNRGRSPKIIQDAPRHGAAGRLLLGGTTHLPVIPPR